MNKVLNDIVPTLDIRFERIKEIESIKTAEAKDAFLALLQEAKAAENIKVQIKCLNSLAPINKKQGFFFLSIRQTISAVQLIKSQNPIDNEMLTFSYKQLGNVYADGFEKYDLALEFFIKGLNCEIDKHKIALYNNIGSVNKELGNYDEALRYLKLGLEEIDRQPNLINVVDQKVYILENLAVVNLKLGKFEKAEKVILGALEICNEHNMHNSYISIIAMNTLAKIYLKLNIKKDTTLQLINNALDIAKNRAYNSVVIELLSTKSEHYLNNGDEKMFLLNLNEAISITKDENLGTNQINCLSKLENYFLNKKDYKNAHYYAKKINNVKIKIEQKKDHYSIADLLENREAEIIGLEAKNAMIKRQNKELEQFAYIVAHDLKEPLRNIGNYCGLVKKRYVDNFDKEGKEFLDFIFKNTKHMYFMLEDLLEYVTVNNPNTKVEYIEPNAIINEILERHKDKIETTATEIVIAELPKTQIRKSHFTILIENLIINAIKFKRPDVALIIEISAIEEDNFVCFTVSDNGIGINITNQQSVFQLFKRLEKEKFEGTGIGLSICQKIVEIYQGTISVENKTSGGCSFHFKILNK